MTITDFLANIRTRLLPVSGDFALPEAERILGFLLNCSRSELYLDRRVDSLSPGLLQKIEAVIARRLTDEPLAYILGSVFFYHREFIVSPDVLIPRPDTEILVEVVLKHETADQRTLIDIGTGSGCIAATLAEHKPRWRATAIDRSFNALTVARKNCNSKVFLTCADLVSALKNQPVFDFIVSNPPYITAGGLAELPASVRDFEPRQALDGGSDGLDFYRKLANITSALLKPGGRIYCEIGYDQGLSVPDIFGSYGWTGIEVTRDYGGRSRVVMATKPPAGSR